MKWLRIAAWVVSFALLGQITWSSESLLPVDLNRAKLRAEVIRLRTEVETLQLDYDIERANIVDDVKTMRSMEMMSGLMVMGNLLNRAATSTPDAPQSPTPAEVKATEESAKKAEEEKVAYIAEKKKKFALLAAALVEKKLDLEDVEARYRELTAGVKLVVDRSESQERVPILDPIPGENAKRCLDPPSEQEIWEKVPRSKDNLPGGQVKRDNACFLIEKIGEKVDPCKDYPLAGLCQLVHCHYKCTITFDETSQSGSPITITQTKARVEVVYIDKDHLRRCGGAVQDQVKHDQIPQGAERQRGETHGKASSPVK